MKRTRLAVEAFVTAREERARARLLSQLDERTLRDIGLGARGEPRARERNRLAMRFGAY